MIRPWNKRCRHPEGNMMWVGCVKQDSGGRWHGEVVISHSPWHTYQTGPFRHEWHARAWVDHILGDIGVPEGWHR